MFRNVITKRRCGPVLTHFLKFRLKHRPSFSMPPPDRWEKYTPAGSVIDGTSLFAFKVPLKQELCTKMEESEKFTPEQLMSTIAQTGQKLGMVVDLTYTQKYYNGSIFKKNSVKHVKIMTAGHNIPDDDVYCTFADCLSDFFAEPDHSGSLVGVHCTHGVNRTGYLICRFMIEKLNIQPEDAISAFGVARGHPIERVNYLNDLRMRTVGNMTPYPKGYVKDENKYSDVKKNADQVLKHHPFKNPSRSIHTNRRDHRTSLDNPNWRDHRTSLDNPNWRDHSTSSNNPNWRDHRTSWDIPNWHDHSNFTDHQNWHVDCQQERCFRDKMQHSGWSHRSHSVSGYNNYNNSQQPYCDDHFERSNGRYRQHHSKNSKHGRVMKGVNYDHDFNRSYGPVVNHHAGYGVSFNHGGQPQKGWGTPSYHGNKVYRRT